MSITLPLSINIKPISLPMAHEQNVTFLAFPFLMNVFTVIYHTYCKIKVTPLLPCFSPLLNSLHLHPGIRQVSQTCPLKLLITPSSSPPCHLASNKHPLLGNSSYPMEFLFSQCALCFTETWLIPDYPDRALQPSGFAVYRHDRNRNITLKSRSGGMCFLVNKNWSTDVQIILQGSTPNLEYITTKCRPFYLPHDSSSITLTAVYIHPHADTSTAVKDIQNTTSKCENDDPNTLSIAA